MTRTFGSGAAGFQALRGVDFAVAAGDFVYLSGMLPTDASGAIVPGDVRVQTARTLDNLAALLAIAATIPEMPAVSMAARPAAPLTARA